jgi:hypothetical protein
MEIREGQIDFRGSQPFPGRRATHLARRSMGGVIRKGALHVKRPARGGYCFEPEEDKLLLKISKIQV